MKKIFTILMTLTLFITAFAGCAKQDSVVIDNKKEEINGRYVSTVTDLVGGTNGQFKEMFNGECTAQISGMGGAMLTDHATGINVLYQFYSGNVWNTDILPNVIYSENPFVDDVKIYRISLYADYDGTAITDQSVLKLVFETDGTVDSKVINKLLEQSPPLEKYEYPLYVSEANIKVTHDIYTAEYAAMGMKFVVTYFDIDGQMVAHNVLMEKPELLQ